MSDVKRWLACTRMVDDEGKHHDSGDVYVLASDYDAEVKAHEMTAPRDCIHGSLARACIVCELQADLTASQARIKELESTVTGLSQACTESERDKEYNAGLVFEWRHKANAAEDALATSRALCDEIRQSGFRSIARADKAEAERNDAVDDLFRYKAASCFKGHAVPPFTCALCEVDRLKAELARRDDLAKMYKIVLADRDRLAGVVERVKDLHRWLKESGTHANEALNLGNVLAEPVGSRCDLDECSVGRNPGSQHGYGKCV